MIDVTREVKGKVYRFWVKDEEELSMRIKLIEDTPTEEENGDDNI
jgi:hypothetical protein